MLDQLSDTDSVLDRKSSANSVNVAGPTRHLSQEELEAYANGRLAAARLNSCQTHLDSCDACRAELEDVRTHQTELSAFTRPETNRRGPADRRARRRILTLPVTAAAAVILAATVVTISWWRHPGLPTRKPSAVAPIARSAATPAGRPPQVAQATPPAPDTANIQRRDTLLAAQIAAPDARQIHDQPPAVLQPPHTNTGFSLLAPLGEATTDRRPKFTWQPLPGAIGYTVTIVDSSLHPVQHSPPQRATSWRPRRPLARDRTYLWQVTATLHGGSKVVASSPTSSAAVLRIGH